ncbi:hypothetical protein OG618_11865 [Kitasatospora sp. NBC_01246]|uniref:hypothetical protein n=1 Tax=Kitasatospora sp. NBC_01246 TaxID=2903570 RepID=UPI002E31DE1B|nr:hypothetical protein [Kitasatospora sp. NBC_01246]
MDLETMPRRTGGARPARPGRRRAAALAGLLLAAAALAGCGDGDGKAAADSATGSASPSASATPSPGSPAPTTASTAPSAPDSPPATPPTDPTASTPDPRPTGPAPGTGPGQTPTPVPTPPREGIAVGEPDPNGRPAHPAITYRVDGTKLTVWFYGGICEKYALKADESKPGRVDVRVTVAAPMPAGQACAELAKRQTVTADLKQPLMGRAVTDLATGQPVPLESDPHVGPDPAGPGPEIGGK